MKRLFPPATFFLAILFLCSSFSTSLHAQQLRVGVAGLKHDHVLGLLSSWKKGEVIIAGIVEEDKQLIEKYKKSHQIPDSLFYPDLATLIAKTKPDAVLAYNPISEHLSVVEVCAPKGISVMVEKPLATTVQQSERMAALAKQYHVHVLTNYETTWYSTNQQIFTLVNDQHLIGGIKKMVVHDGHEGPKEIGCTTDFLNWLTDPVKNGAGALNDFGCYGANLMTWLMKGKAPIAVTAITRHYKPNVYPKVDDDATILVEYENATGLIEASWNWPYGIKDMEVFGETGYYHALNGKDLQQRMRGGTYEAVSVNPPKYAENLTYLADVLHGKTQPGDDLSSLNNNLVVVKILEAAKKSAREGRRIVF